MLSFFKKNNPVNEPDVRVSSTEQHKTTIPQQSAYEYLKILQPKKGSKRMEFNPNLPKTLTPKGFAKFQLMANMADKQYGMLVKQLKKSNKLWEDPDFPADDSSIGVERLTTLIQWKRPKEINKNAEIFVGGASRFDIEQGSLGDCLLLAVISSISCYPTLFEQIVPKEQKISSPDYVGVFRARIWRFGEWVEVLVDDRLPCIKGSDKLVFMHSADSKEFWSALLEKAYAKLNGGYNNLSGGTQSEVMEDVTGGLCETIDMKNGVLPEGFPKQLKCYADRCCLMNCLVDSKVIEEKLDNGLIAGHAYSVTGAKYVTYKGENQLLVCCQNPRIGNYKWKGAWSDKSDEWNHIPPKERKDLTIGFNHDGEFWISYEDFVKCFSRLEVCHLGLGSLEHGQNFRGKRRLEETVFSGQWEKNINAGGCKNNVSTFWMNPQFLITVTDPDPDDDDKLCSVQIGLMQKDMRRKIGDEFEAIGFMVYSIPEGHSKQFRLSEIVDRKEMHMSEYTNAREVTVSLRLEPGDYLIIPSTFDAHRETNFILRVFCQSAFKDKELDGDNSNPDIHKHVTDLLKMRKITSDEDEEIEKKFNEMMNKVSNSIDSSDLQQLLNGSSLRDISGFEGFSIEMCRSMLASVDHNLTGRIEFAEFADLWQHLQGWKVAFSEEDPMSRGSMYNYKFRETLKSAGYCVSNKLFNTLVHRYQDPKKERMSYEEFMLCCVRLKTAFETVTAQPKLSDGASMFMEEDYLRYSVYI